MLLILRHNIRHFINLLKGKNMKKIFLLFAAVCALVACNPVHEDIGNGGHITLEELLAKTTVSVDKSASGQNGNVITCSTSAPVNALWNIGGKSFIGNYAWKKMKLGSHTVILTALCADGTELTAEFPIECQEITNPLEKIYLFGSADNENPAVLGPGDAAAGRFSDGEGKFFPYLSDDVYFGKKTLIFDIIAAEEGPFIWGSDVGCTCRVMNGWWSSTYADNVPLSVGLWELPITDAIAAECAQGGDGKDLDILMTRGSITVKSVYYEE
jgi:hypothetical protein